MKDRIQFTNLLKSFTLKNPKKTSLWIEHVINSHGQFPGEISYIFCDDAYLSILNKQYLHHTSLTDIITFNYNTGHLINGDIFISIQRVTENAKKFSTSVDEELRRVMIHGILHLLGFDDKTESSKKKMTSEENSALRQYEYI
ncbi:MAG: rRNA maturation RNase YbeY [Chitinophagales bacterium]